MYPNAIYACSLNATFYTSSKRVGMERLASEGKSCNSRKPGGSDRYHSDKTKDMTRFILSGP